MPLPAAAAFFAFCSGVQIQMPTPFPDNLSERTTGSLVLVTHDRYMLDRVSNIVLGLDGQGSAESFADYAQWESWHAQSKLEAPASAPLRIVAGSEDSALAPKKKLSYLEAREHAGIEQKIAEAALVLQNKRAPNGRSCNCN